MQYLIGSDVGTSGTKTVLFDETGKIVETAFREYPLYQIKSGWAEQDPRDWAEAVLATVREVLEKSGIAPDKVKGCLLYTSMGSFSSFFACFELMYASACVSFLFLPSGG